MDDIGLIHSERFFIVEFSWMNFISESGLVNVNDEYRLIFLGKGDILMKDCLEDMHK